MQCTTLHGCAAQPSPGGGRDNTYGMLSKPEGPPESSLRPAEIWSLAALSHGLGSLRGSEGSLSLVFTPGALLWPGAGPLPRQVPAASPRVRPWDVLAEPGAGWHDG